MEHGAELSVSIMPWVGLQREVQIGSVKFWPWEAGRAGITDPVMKDTIQHYVDCFVDHQGNPVKTASVCSYKGKEFQCPTDNEWPEMRAARDALVFSVICPQVVRSIQGCSIGLCSAERFQVVGQQLKPGSTTLYVLAGYNTTFGQFKVPRPLTVSAGFLAQPESTLVSAFDRVFADSFPGDVRTRLFGSLEWFRLAHVEADQVSEFSRIVMMATAFETLLGIPAGERDKSLFFAKKVDERFRTQGSVYATRGHKNQDRKLTKAAWWAYDFYKLRNKIVHGDDVTPADIRYSDHVLQKSVADAALYQILFRLLCENGCIDYPSYTSHLPPEEREDCFLCFRGFEDTQQALGWMTE
ncbi:MAG: hypothetical protein JW955_15090 [Sedimentisphaerales bacterium]|nr:hypothetical protein [Sedimentisphaerales bacterium]